MLIRLVFIGTLWICTVSNALSEEVKVAVAANFAAPMKRIAEQFETTTGHEATLVFGSSGRFYAQIVNGAPFDVFFSADQVKPKKLVETGLAIAQSRFTYAVGSLVLWSADKERIESGPEILRSAGIDKVAIANPRLAPYGAAALEALHALNLTRAVQPKLVQGENIAQTYQFVSSGNADVGFLARSQVWRDGQLLDGSAWVVPRNLYAPIRQDALILRKGADNPAAKALLAFMRGDFAVSVLHSFGYGNAID